MKKVLSLIMLLLMATMFIGCDSTAKYEYVEESYFYGTEEVEMVLKFDEQEKDSILVIDNYYKDGESMHRELECVGYYELTVKDYSTIEEDDYYKKVSYTFVGYHYIWIIEYNTKTNEYSYTVDVI